MDGTPTLRMNEFMLATVALNKIDLGPARDKNTGAQLPPPTELSFKVNADIEASIIDAKSRFDALVGSHDLHVRLFSD